MEKTSGTDFKLYLCRILIQGQFSVTSHFQSIYTQGAAYGVDDCLVSDHQLLMLWVDGSTCPQHSMTEFDTIKY